MSKAAELARLIGDGTFGTGGAEDKKIVFDGNAQDFHIGLDDSADDLVIGLGSALGTTTHMSFDENGQILKPLQCYFHVTKNADQSNFAVGSQVDVTFETEIKDIGSNFASNTFTAPVTGTYALYLSMRVDNIETAAAYYAANINTSNRQYRWIEHFNTSGGDYNYITIQLFAIADMDASDTAACQIYQHSSTQQSDIKNDTSRTYFQGYLLG